MTISCFRTSFNVQSILIFAIILFLLAYFLVFSLVLIIYLSGKDQIINLVMYLDFSKIVCI